MSDVVVLDLDLGSPELFATICERHPDLPLVVVGRQDAEGLVPQRGVSVFLALHELGFATCVAAVMQAHARRLVDPYGAPTQALEPVSECWAGARRHRGRVPLSKTS